MGFSTEFWKQERYTGSRFEDYGCLPRRLPQALLRGHGPNDLLAMMWKWQRGDVARHTGGDLAAALGRITAKTFVLPIDEDMFFPIRDHVTEQAHIKGSELRVINDVLGHLGLFAVNPDYMPQIDRHLGELLATPV